MILMATSRAEPAIARAVHRGHATVTDLLEDLVLVEVGFAFDRGGQDLSSRQARLRAAVPPGPRWLLPERPHVLRRP